MKRSLPRASQTSGWVAEALDQLLESMRDEHDALVHDDFDRLAQSVHRKEQTLRRLATGLKAADSAALREVFRSLRDLNEQNARLLLPRLRMNRARIETLLGATRASALYSASGHAAGADHRPAQRGVRA